MASEERIKELTQGLYNAVIQMDEDGARELSQAVVDEGVDAYQAITNGLTAAMEEVSELYTSGEYFVPELLLCSDALYAGLDVLKPHLKVEQVASNRKVIIGTVEGDIHDIGKNLVKIMFETAGWDVHDLGKDVLLPRFVEEQAKVQADLVALSALMSTSMLAMPKVIEMLRREDPDIAVLVGGAPLSRDIAESYGANGYADDAVEAIKEANDILTRLGR
jgi:methylmalonyl-CoA mutase cobalamin-binding domain/chain